MKLKVLRKATRYGADGLDQRCTVINSNTTRKAKLLEGTSYWTRWEEKTCGLD